jgi:hypothetical protein
MASASVATLKQPMRSPIHRVRGAMAALAEAAATAV